MKRAAILFAFLVCTQSAHADTLGRVGSAIKHFPAKVGHGLKKIAKAPGKLFHKKDTSPCMKAPAK